MWPFSQMTPLPIELTPIEQIWKRVHHEYPIGARFRYLGKSMMIARHDWYSIKYPAAIPGFVAQYEDDIGKIQEHLFNADLAPLMLGQDVGNEREYKPENRA